MAVVVLHPAQGQEPEGAGTCRYEEQPPLHTAYPQVAAVVLKIGVHLQLLRGGAVGQTAHVETVEGVDDALPARLIHHLKEAVAGGADEQTSAAVAIQLLHGAARERSQRLEGARLLIQLEHR